MEVDSAIASSLIGAAATIIVAVIARPSQAERGRTVDRDIEILKLLDQMDRPSQDGEMHALKVEVARRMVDERMEVRPMSDREQTLAVAARHPFLTFYAFWLLSYLLLGGEDTAAATQRPLDIKKPRAAILADPHGAYALRQKGKGRTIIWQPMRTQGQNSAPSARSHPASG